MQTSSQIYETTGKHLESLLKLVAAQLSMNSDVSVYRRMSRTCKEVRQAEAKEQKHLEKNGIKRSQSCVNQHDECLTTPLAHTSLTNAQKHNKRVRKPRSRSTAFEFCDKYRQYYRPHELKENGAQDLNLKETPRNTLCRIKTFLSKSRTLKLHD